MGTGNIRNSESDAGARILALKRDVEQSVRLRAEASAAHQLAVTQLAAVDAKLAALGVTPDTAETELAALDAQLRTIVETLQISVAAEIRTYDELLAAARAVIQGDRT